MPRLRKDQKKLIEDAKKLLKTKPKTRVQAMLQALMAICIKRIEESK